MADLNVTIVVPVRDEEGVAVVDILAAETRSPEALIFVDAGSVDQTPRPLKQACTLRPGWPVIEAGRAAPGRARDIGIKAASTDWMAVIDASWDADRDWLDRLIATAGTGTIAGWLQAAVGAPADRGAG